MSRRHTLLLLVLFAPRLAFAADTTAPTATSVVIAGGAAYTNTSTVSLSLSASDDVGVTQMCISTATTCTSWVSYAATYSYSLGTTQGTRTVHAKFRDAAGNTSSQISDTIVLDTAGPTGGSVVAATASSGELAVSWSGFSDSYSGIDSYTLAYRTGSSPATKCTNGTVVSGLTGSSTTLTGLTDGTTYYLRVCPVDGASNVGNGATATGAPVAESNPPTGTVIINSGDTYATSTSVTLSISATDDTGVTSMCVSNTTTCSSWQSYTTTKSWSFAGQGDRTVYVYFKDASGNVSTAATDNIMVDTVTPINGTVTATAGDGSVDLSWTGFSDATSGIAYYKVVYGTGTPANCSTGTLAYSGTDTSLSITGLSNGTSYGFRVCAVDNAGKVSTGATVLSTPVSELDPPTDPSVVINGGADWTNSQTVSLTLSANDASGVAYVCLSNTTACTTWTAYTTTRSWLMAPSGAERTVYASFKDSNGNVSTQVSDSILYDVVKPTNGSITLDPDSTSVTVSWSGFSDARSGVDRYKVVFAPGTIAPGVCNIGNVGYEGTDTSATISDLYPNRNYAFRVCAIDNAGNVSDGVEASTLTTSDSDPPINGSVVINSGATWTNSQTVSVSTYAEDLDSGMSSMCIGESAATCSAWISYGTTASYTFSSTEGTRTLYAYYKDVVGNQTSVLISDDIGLDRTAPTDGTVSGSLSGDTASLTWSGFTDARSGVSSYQIAYMLDGSAPSDCQSADVVESTTTTSIDINGLAPLTYELLVCAIDAAGNVSDGATVTVGSCVPTTWYADADGDSYGDATSTTSSCTQPSGYVDNDDDCNDSASAINPGATESCDSIDNDCDGLTDDADTSITGQSTWYADTDGDSYGDSGDAMLFCTQPSGYVANDDDCNDSADAAYPGAAESCDGIDNDCDGLVDSSDPSATGTGTWYADTDNDGYGNATVSQTTCTQPSGYVANDDDCNDAAAAINPAATESCDDVDNDCDGLIDDADIGVSGQSTWYADADGDTYGNAASTQAACDQPSGYVTDNTDCDDADASAYMEYTWYLDADNDGYGDEGSSGVVACHDPSSSGMVDTTADTTLTGPTSGSNFGFSILTSSDVNGDGYGDVIVGANAYDSNRGQVLVYHGTASGLSTTPALTLSGESIASYFGYTTASVGDVNGDGFDDVAIGSYGYSSLRGRAYVYHGGASGLSSVAAQTWTGEGTSNRFGQVITGPGDLNNDGYDDVVVAAYGYSSSAGRAYVYLGGAGGVASTAAATLTGQGTSNLFGSTVGKVGDVNNDGFDDVVVGAYGYASSTGRMYLYHGASSGLVTTAATTVTGQATANNFSATLSGVGDINHDGYDDVMSGAFGYSSNTGRAYLFHGNSAGLANAATYTGEATTNFYGYTITNVGDVSGDSYDDVMVGGYQYGSGSGRAYLYHGSSSGLATTAAQALTGEATTNYYGSIIRRVGDVNGDDRADVVVTAPGYSSQRGRAYLYHGSDSGLGTAAASTFTGEAASSIFANSVGEAVDINGDGVNDIVIGAYSYSSATGRVYVYLGDPGTSYVREDLNTADCDDTNAAINPGAAEVCDSLDNDCDGLVDDADGTVTGQGTYYADLDGDTYGDVATLLDTCTMPSGYVTDATDCDDSLDTVNPGEVEVCDTLDNDCDGLADDDDSSVTGQTTWYADNDLDTYGDAGASVVACFSPGDYVTNSLDCDDTDIALNLDYTWYLDADWDGYGDEGTAVVACADPSDFVGMEGLATTTWTGEVVGDLLGDTLMSNGDVNGDGYDDVVIGAPYYSSGTAANGRVYVYHGSASGPSTIAATTLTGAGAGYLLGEQIKYLGDINGDGYDDVAVGARGYSSYTGRVYVHHGSASGLVSAAATTLTGENTFDMFGEQLHAIGDVNGDGYHDLMVNAPRYNNHSGRAYIYHGSASGLVSTAAITLTGEGTTNYLGTIASSQVDINQDGYDDVVLSAYGYSSYTGRFYVYHGSTSGIASTANVTLTGATGDRLGIYVDVVGDTNGDGYPDMMVGADTRDSQRGAAYLYHGSSSGLQTVPASTITGDNPYDNLGQVFGPAGDVNADGYADVIVNAPGADLSTGEARIYHGSALGLTWATTVVGTEESTYFGYSNPVGTGDMNGDGYDDVILGSSFTNANTGHLGLYPGGPSGISTTPELTWEGGAPSDFFGLVSSRQGDVDGDGDVDLVVSAYGHDSGRGQVYLYSNIPGTSYIREDLNTADCDDTNAAINPGEAEVCDGLDNDCDALVDDADGSVGGQGTWYADTDGDSFGDITNIIDFCMQPSGYVADSTDCNDGDLTINPDADEVCDTLDNNCNDLIDDDDGSIIGQTMWYADNDLDTYGDASAAILACFSPGDYVTNDLDCDDTDIALNLEHTWYIDADHDGYGDTSVGVTSCADPSSSSPLDNVADTVMTGEGTSNFSLSASGAGDVNGDGFDDVIIGAYAYNSYTGRAYVYHGGLTGLSSIAATTWTGAGTNNYFGETVSKLGDLNQDGYDDVGVGARIANRAYIYHGSATGLSTTAATTLVGGSGTNFSTVLKNAGDVNGDGYDDVIVDANRYGTWAGQVTVYHGSASGISSTATTTINGEGTYNYFGNRIVPLGDVNDDGYDDVIVSAQGYNSSQGRVYLYHGSASGLTTTAAMTLTGEATNNYFGESFSVGDVNADNNLDLLVTGYGYSGLTGRAYVYHGTASGIETTASFTETGTAANSQFSRGSGFAGDLNGDGYDDLAIAHQAYSSSIGAVYVHYGSATGSSPTPVIIVGQGGAYMNAYTDPLGDINGDGYDDLFVSARIYNSSSGRAYLYYGSAAGVPTTADVIFNGESASYFGTTSVSPGDVNGDGSNDLLVGAYNYSSAVGRAYLYLGETSTWYVRDDLNTADPDDTDPLVP